MKSLRRWKRASVLRCGLALALWLGSARLAAEPEPPRTVAAMPAAASPAAPASLVLPTTPMLGPFASIKAYCATLANSGAGRCDPGRGPFARGWQRGQRGPFTSATTLTVSRRIGPHVVKTCHVTLRTKQGFYVSADEAICEGAARGERRKTALGSLHWVDQVGFGVLAANSEQLRRANVDEFRWWGMISLESDVSELHTMLCGMTRTGIPACSASLASSCGKDNTQLLEFEGNRLVSTPSRDTRWLCSGEALPTGKYALPFTDLLEPRPAPTDERPAAVATPLFGPFASLQQYCADPPSGFSPFEAGAQVADDQLSFDFEDEAAESPKPAYRWVPDPLSREARCDRRPGRWNPRRLSGPEPLLSVELVRMQADMAGAPIEWCRIALSTPAGVFVSDSTDTCQGVIGPGSAIKTRVLGLRWLDAKPNRVLYIELEQAVDNPVRSAILCAVGPSGVPSCAGNYPLSCWNGTVTVGLNLTLKDGFVTLSPSAAPPNPEVETYLECSIYREPVPLSFP